MLEFNPDWVIPPGATILDGMRERHLSVENLFLALGRTPEWTQRLLDGQEAIDMDIAVKLSVFIGGTVQFWLALDKRYWAEKERLKK